MNWVDWVGYAASALIVVSFLLSRLSLVRAVNVVGCVCFVIYGAFKGPLWPIIVPNVILICIHFYALWKLKVAAD